MCVSALNAHRWFDRVDAEGPSFKSELAIFQKLQHTLTDICHEHTAHPVCMWYGMLDIQALWLAKTGQMKPVPFE